MQNAKQFCDFRIYNDKSMEIVYVSNNKELI